MFLAISRFSVANETDAAVREAFRARPHKVDEAPGFVRMAVASPTDDPKEFWLLTYWRDEASFDAWHRSHAFHDAHHGMPRGLKLDPAATRLLRLAVIAE